MKTTDLIGSAIGNTFRSKTRTTLTVLAIFVGAFTLTLTNGLGTGINQFIDDQVSSIGASDVMTITKTAETEESSSAAPDASGLVEYNENAIDSGTPTGPGQTSTLVALTSDDIATLAAIPGVLEAQAVQNVSADYVQLGDATKYVATIGTLVPGQEVLLAAGEAPSDDSSELQVAVPLALAEAWGYDDAAGIVGSEVTIAVTDANDTQSTVVATITGVTEETLTGAGTSLVPNEALTEQLTGIAETGLSAEDADRFASASIRFDADASDEDIAALKTAIEDAGYTATTVEDQLGTIKTVIDAIVLVLNAFAAIALVAAGFGIVNTLLMSVQERTREIGLMKAMGMSSGRVFSLFSLEAAVIGLAGSALGTVIGMLVGTAASDALATGLFADVAGLNLIAFDPATVAITIAIIVGMALLAGAIPAARAAAANPVESLRYE